MKRYCIQNTAIQKSLVKVKGLQVEQNLTNIYG